MNYTTAQLRKTLFNSKKGFTLIELLVVIAIIAVLAIMGFAAFSGLTGRGNDDRRLADMKAYADAMEVRRGTSSNYTSISATDFSSGEFPRDPSTGSRTPVYCYADSTSAPIANPTTAQWGAGTPTACPTGFASTNGVAPTVTTGALYFKFCALNQAGSTNTTATGANIICQGSRQ